MFELSFIKKYLTPKKKQLSVSLIALLSVAVITLVVWLVVVFISVTEGIEKTWLHKLTALNAPLRLQPTKEYFSSYYYNVDRYSASSHYLSQTIGQKAKALISDPYNPKKDEELPPLLAKPDRDAMGDLKDPVKGVLAILDDLKKTYPGLAYQDVEMSGALLRLELVRQEANSLQPVEMHSQLTHVSYLASLSEKNPSLSDLILKPSIEDLNHLLFLASRDKENPRGTLSHSQIQKLKTKSDLWPLPVDFLPEKISFFAEAYEHEGGISHIMVFDRPITKSQTIEKRGKKLFYKKDGEPEYPLDIKTPLFAYGNIEFSVQEQGEEGSFFISASLQNQGVSGWTSLEGLEVAKASFDTVFASLPSVLPPWAFTLKDKESFVPRDETKTGILLAKNFRDNGVRMGDSGYLAYSAPTSLGSQERHLLVYVAGFYDPGIMAVGNKCILVPNTITQTINSFESPFTLERSEANVLHVWFSHLQEAPKIKTALLERLRETGLEKYWKVETFREYDFAKDLMQQFDSDKYLFTLIGVIILLVACTNIISLLVLLVSDKKKEIGILRAMGAKRRSIATIFALSGGSLGFFSCLLGVFLAFLTLRNIDSVVSFLSFLQGHEAFNVQFFGQSLPHEMSPRALVFAAIATPLFALLAGLFPAIKAARLNPCESLRS